MTHTALSYFIFNKIMSINFGNKKKNVLNSLKFILSTHLSIVSEMLTFIYIAICANEIYHNKKNKK